MATTAVTVAKAATATATTTAGGIAKTFRTGTKKVFLPPHTITFLAPKKNQPPTFARFIVPLTFNKLDMRDYLLHAYKVPVIAVRSLIQQRPIKTAKVGGRIYRPPPIKNMIVELTKPFVWPQRPKDVKPWRSAASKKATDAREEQDKARELLDKTGVMRLRDETNESLDRTRLRREATRLLEKGGWNNKRELDVRFLDKDAVKAN
ncbi:hypothetical protein F4861DRAFT_540613 [Xylaria intraflava]|nr:hypothetical protein F4861DRAFT_540613 [Xylaria intraflava]